MVSMLASSMIDRGCESRSGQTKDYDFNICCFFAKHPTARRQGKEYLAQWTTCLPTFVAVSWQNKYPAKHVGLIKCGHHHCIIRCNLFSPWYIWNIASFGVKQQSLTHSHTHWRYFIPITGGVSINNDIISNHVLIISQSTWNIVYMSKSKLIGYIVVFIWNSLILL